MIEEYSITYSMTAETKKENGKKKILIVRRLNRCFNTAKEGFKGEWTQADFRNDPILALENFKAGLYDFYWISKCQNGWIAFAMK